MSLIDKKWLESENGKKILQAIIQNDRIKRFGLLERPQLSLMYANYEEMSYKIMLMGKSNSGKTSFIETIFESKVNFGETPGIHVNNLYWPVKIKSIERFLMFKLSLWDVGKVCSMKYDYIIPSCTKNLDGIVFIFSWTDTQSFLEVTEYIQDLEQNGKKFAKLVVGTKYDQIAHSEITQKMIDDFEEKFEVEIIRFSIANAKFDYVSEIVNKLAEALWSRDTELANTRVKPTQYV